MTPTTETSETPFNLQNWGLFGPATVLAALIGVFVAMMVFMAICWCLNKSDKAPNQVKEAEEGPEVMETEL